MDYLGFTVAIFATGWYFVERHWRKRTERRLILSVLVDNKLTLDQIATVVGRTTVIFSIDELEKEGVLSSSPDPNIPSEYFRTHGNRKIYWANNKGKEEVSSFMPQ